MIRWLANPSASFSFCVALYEALYGVLPFTGDTIAAMAFAVLQGRVDEPPPGVRVPPRLRRILLRGLSVESDDRYPSMAALLDELGRDVWVRRRRWLLSAFVLGTLGLGAALYLETRAAQGRVCAAHEVAFEGIWDGAQKRRIRAAFLATERSFAEDTWSRVAAALDAYTVAWREMSRSACEATHVYNQQSPELLHLRMACLARRQSQVRALSQVFSVADDKTVDKAVALVASLSGVEDCADQAALESEVLPPEDASTRAEVGRLEQRLDDARAQLGAGRYREGLEIAAEVATAAAPLAYPPLLGEAQLVLGKLRGELGETEAAEEALKIAITEASRGRDARRAAEGWIELIELVGVHRAQFDEALALRMAAEAALAWASAGRRELALSAQLARVSGEVLRMKGALPEAEAAARQAVELMESAPASGALTSAREGAVSPALADALMGVGRLLRQRGEYDEAKEVYGRALEIRVGTLGPGHPDVASAQTGLGNTALAEGKYDEARDYLEQALTIRVTALGASHAKVATTENSLGAVHQAQGQYDEAERHFRRALKIRETVLGAKHPEVATARMNLGNALLERGDVEGARAQYLQALAAQRASLGETHPNVAYTLNNLGVIAERQEALAAAEDWYRKALAVREQALGAEHPDLASNLDSLGRVVCEQQRCDEARALLERALAMREAALGASHPDYASSLVSLAQLDARQGRHEQANAALERAVAIYAMSLPPGHPLIAETQLERARVDLSRERWEPAITRLEAIVALREQEHTASDAVLDQARFELARALWAGRGRSERGRAVALARAARDDYARRSDAGAERRREAIVRWLSTHRG